MIRGNDMHMADEALRSIAERTPTDPVNAITTALRIERTALNNYISHHLSTFRQGLILAGVEFDPRLDSVAGAIIRHVFLAGVHAGRREETR